MSVLVTGAGRGIGRALAVSLSALGPVALLSRSRAELEATARLVSEADGTAIALVVDVTDEQALRDAVAAAVTALGPVEVLVNNAGRSGSRAELSAGDIEPWAATMAVNLLAPAMLAAAVLPGMVQRGRGYVLNINSLAGSRSFRGWSAYGASKAALMRLTEGLAVELDGTGVCVFDLSPGLVRTAMTEEPELAALFAGVPEEDWTPVAKVTAAALALTSGRYDALSGRFLHAEDDLDDVLARIDAAGPDARHLRLNPAGADDPLFS